MSIRLNILLFKQLNLRRFIVEVCALLCDALIQEHFCGFLFLSKPSIVHYFIAHVKSGVF